MTFKTEMMWTKVSCSLCCVAISWFTHFLIMLTPLVVAVPVSQLSASPKKGGRLILVCLLEVETPLKEGSFFRCGVAAKMSGL